MVPDAQGQFVVTPTGFGRSGAAIVRVDGQTFSIPGGIPGERVRVRRMAKRSGVVHTRIVDLLQMSSERGDPPCREVEHGCGGCQWQHIGINTQRKAKRERVADALRLDPKARELEQVVSLPKSGYRTTLQAAVAANGRAGLRRYRSHVVVPVDGCYVAHPLLTELLTDAEYPGASEVKLRCGARTGERMAVPEPGDTPMRVPADVRTDFVHEEAAGRMWRISADSFFQAGPDAVDALAAQVTRAADEMTAGRALDLYAGVGIFAGVLADLGWKVTAVEGAPSAVADAERNLADDDVEVIGADVNRWMPPDAELVVADPSRNGLMADGVTTVIGSGASRIVLVSCETEALRRDAALLKRAGYRLTRATPIDAFAHTYHVEVVSVFDR